MHLRDHKRCFKNFANMLKPGGMLIIDHRNYDYILKHGRAPKKNIYYNSKHIRVGKTNICSRHKYCVLGYSYSSHIWEQPTKANNIELHNGCRGRRWLYPFLPTSHTQVIHISSQGWFWWCFDEFVMICCLGCFRWWSQTHYLCWL